MSDDKTEEPTPRKLRQAEEQGDLPISAALTSSMCFLVATMALPLTVTRAASAFGSMLRGAGGASPSAALSGAALGLAGAVGPLLLSGAAVALVAGVAQTRGVIAVSKLAPDLSRLSPERGVPSLLSADRARAALRGTLTAGVMVLVVRARLSQGASLLGGEAQAVAEGTARLLATLLRDAALVLLASSLIDVVLVRRSYAARLRMTRAEVKQESKESEGDPQLKAARERAHHELLTQASINAVKGATVVVVNPTHLATALRFVEGEDDAPRVVTKGEGALAASIIEAARAYGVPVVRDVPLARALHELEVGDEIPESLYEAVAELLRALWAEAEACGDQGDAGS